MFAKDFVFGVATAAYQIEGTQGKFKTIWDLDYQKIIDQSNTQVACDHYHRYEEDIKLIKDLGASTYRLSISWARLEPTEAGFSDEGVAFYHRLFQTIKKAGLNISATLYHWDMPLWLYEKGIGFDHPEIIEKFLAYAKKVFLEFDQYVDQWATFNEPWCMSVVAYYYGTHAPWIKSAQRMIQASYYLLIAHKEVVKYYRSIGKKPIGIVINLWTQYPASDSLQDLIATENSEVFHNRHFLEPLFKGHFTESFLIRLKALGVNLDFMDAEAVKEVAEPIDFLGINYYTSQHVQHDEQSDFKFGSAQTDLPKTAMDWDVDAPALRDLIIWIRKEYTNLPIYITENGAAYEDVLLDQSVEDQKRTQYYQEHLKVLEDINVELNVKGYYAWSLLDNYEWAFGYTKRFGLVYVDYKSLKRLPKASYYYYQKVINNRKV